MLRCGEGLLRLFRFGDGGFLSCVSLGESWTEKVLIIKSKYFTPKTIIRDKTNRKAVDSNPAKNEERILNIIYFLFKSLAREKLLIVRIFVDN